MIKYIIGSFLILLLIIKIYDVFKKYKESFKTIFIFEAKVVSAPSTKKKGLMNRTNNLKENQGMLFVFDEPQAISLWMKNTYIPLDAIYFNEDGKILELNENLKPKSTKSVVSKQPCKYVLEVNGNTIKNKNIKIGNYIKITKIKNLK
jgi:uncharacterized protein